MVRPIKWFGRIQSKNYKEKMCGTIKSGILEDNDNLHIILACIIYDTKPVHILIIVTKNITWPKINKIMGSIKGEIF